MSRLVKRIIDVAAAMIGLIGLAVIMAAVAVAIRLTMGSPVLFRQSRIGLHGRPFELLKFRTMIESTDETGTLRPDHERLTRLGKFLRKTSLDELPQLWNVLKGEMSIVGPRPLPVEYLSLYSNERHRRHEVPQGIVGWAGVKGRNLNTWDKKFELDLWYVNNWSLLLDAKIVCMAFLTVLSGAGVSQEGFATAPKLTADTHEESDTEGSANK
jgi:sugar transferase EpsL